MARSRAESLYFKNLLAILGSNYILGVKIPDLGRKKSKNVIFDSFLLQKHPEVADDMGFLGSACSACQITGF